MRYSTRKGIQSLRRQNISFWPARSIIPWEIRTACGDATAAGTLLFALCRTADHQRMRFRQSETFLLAPRGTFQQQWPAERGGKAMRQYCAAKVDGDVGR